MSKDGLEMDGRDPAYAGFEEFVAKERERILLRGVLTTFSDSGDDSITKECRAIWRSNWTTDVFRQHSIFVGRLTLKAEKSCTS